MREAQVRRQVVAYLGKLAKDGYPVCHRSNPPSPFDGVSGDPDLIACVAGRTIVIELEHPDWRPTPAWERTPQARRLKAWQAAGALGGIVRSRAEVDVMVQEVLHGSG